MRRRDVWWAHQVEEHKGPEPGLDINKSPDKTTRSRVGMDRGSAVSRGIQRLDEPTLLEMSYLKSSPSHYLVAGARRFNSSNQFCTTLICVLETARPTSLIIRKRWPSGETS